MARRLISAADIEAWWQALPIGRANALLAHDLAVKLGWLDANAQNDKEIEAAKRRVRLAAQKAAKERRLFASDDKGYWRPLDEDLPRLRRVADRYIAMGTRTLARGRELEAAIVAHLHQGRLV